MIIVEELKYLMLYFCQNGTFDNSQYKYLFIEIGQKFKTNMLIIYSKEKKFYNCDFILFDSKNNNPDSVFSYIPIKCD